MLLCRELDFQGRFSVFFFLIFLLVIIVFCFHSSESCDDKNQEFVLEDDVFQSVDFLFLTIEIYNYSKYKIMRCCLNFN